MSLPRNKKNKHKKPYEDVFIYLIDGILNESDEFCFGSQFIGNWVEDTSSFLFFSAPADKEVESLVKLRDDLKLNDTFKFSYEEWQGGGFQEIRIGNILISPPWNSKHVSDEFIHVFLDPGVVFGNGLHATTKDCVKALLYLARNEPYDYVLDIGTGTGILAVTAGVLGAKGVIAVDLNPLCVKTAIKNASLNCLDNIVTVAEGTAEDFINEPADLIVANIHHEVVCKLFEDIRFRTHPKFIISGLMRSQAREVREQVEKYGLIVTHEWDHEMTWHTMLIQNVK